MVSRSDFVGKVYKARSYLPWYHASDFFPWRFMTEGTLVEVLEILPYDRVRIRFKDTGEDMTIFVREFNEHFEEAQYLPVG